MDNINISANSTTVSGHCPQCGGIMTPQGNKMVCPFCGYTVANLDQNININQNINQNVKVTNITKPQYDFVIHLTGIQKAEVYKYSIVSLDTKQVVDSGRTTATQNTTALNFSLPTGYYEINLGKYKRKVYVDDMHTVDFQFINTGKRNHINIVGEIQPPAQNGEAPQQAVRAAGTQSVKPAPRRKPVFLIFGIIFILLLIGAIAGEMGAGFIIFSIIGVIVFWALYFLSDIKKLVQKDSGNTPDNK